MKESQEIIPTIKKVKPTNTLPILFFGPMECEQQTAEIINKTILCASEEDIRAVAYRALQTKSGQTQTKNQILFWGLVALGSFGVLFLFTYMIVRDLEEQGYGEEYIAIVAQLFLLWAGITSNCPLYNIPPNIANTLRYKETKDACDVWLSQKIGQDAVKKLDKLPYDEQGFFETNKLLDDLNIPKASFKNIPSRFKALQEAPKGASANY